MCIIDNKIKKIFIFLNTFRVFEAFLFTILPKKVPKLPMILLVRYHFHLIEFFIKIQFYKNKVYNSNILGWGDEISYLMYFLYFYIEIKKKIYKTPFLVYI